jgi:hypothetical protein
MTKFQNAGIRTMKRKRNMTPQNFSNHTTNDIRDSEENETSISELKKMISMINEMKEDM